MGGTKWKLNKVLGVIMLVLYAAFLVYSIVAGVQQAEETEKCEGYGVTDIHLGHVNLLRNTADGELYSIYGEEIFEDYNYDPLAAHDMNCRDVCGNRFADNLD